MAKFLSTRAETKFPAPLAPDQQSVGDQSVERFAHRNARHREIRRQIAFRGQRIIRTQNAAVDGLAQRPLQFLIERQIALTIQGTNGFCE